MFERYLARWDLEPDGAPLTTHSSRLLPVRRRHDGVAAMLKVALVPEERRGARLMRWWDGDGAARVLAHRGPALLLERIEGGASLAEMARNGRDDEASRILCVVAARLHAPRPRPLPPLVPLARWFEPLGPAATRHGGLLARAAAVARELLAEPREVVPLHGDLHHDNVLDAGPERGWLAIDPKQVAGERGFDFANLFRDPDAATATAPGRLARQSWVVAEAAGLDRAWLLRWVLAFAGLSAAWMLDDGDEPLLDLTVATIAAAELART
jgi:streptomycin 6-kinase